MLPWDTGGCGLPSVRAVGAPRGGQANPAAPPTLPAVCCPFAWGLQGRSAAQPLSLQRRKRPTGVHPTRGMLGGVPSSKSHFCKSVGVRDSVGAPWAETRGPKPLCCTRDLLPTPRPAGGLPPPARYLPARPGGGASLSPLPRGSPALSILRWQPLFLPTSLPTGGRRVLRGWFCRRSPLSPLGGGQGKRGGGCWGPRCCGPQGHLPWGAPGCWHPLFPGAGPCSSLGGPGGGWAGRGVCPWCTRSLPPPRSPPAPAAPGTDPGLRTVAGTVRVPPVPAGVFLSGGPRTRGTPPQLSPRGSTGRSDLVYFQHLSIFKRGRSRQAGYDLARQYTVPAAFSTRARK